MIYVRGQFAKLPNMPVDAIGSTGACGELESQGRDLLTFGNHGAPITIVVLRARIDMQCGG